MFLLVGLGNPGPQYALTRHNIGFLAADVVARFYDFPDFKRKGQSLISEGLIEGKKTLLLKPMTFMNLSGHAVAEISSFYKIPLENILVVHDDLDLSFNRVRLKKGGGTGGHNGLKSLDGCIGKDYWRVRIGIDHPGDREKVSGYVLSSYTSKEQEEVADLLGVIAENIPLLFNNDRDRFIQAMPQPLTKD